VAFHVQRRLDSLTRPPRVYLAGGLAFAVGVLVGLLTPGSGGGSSVAKAASASALRIGTELPAWRAPGARLEVAGRDEPGRRVSLVVGGRRIAAATAGPLGRFVLSGRLPSAGLHRVEVRSGSDRLRLGRLLVRPVRLAAVGDVTPGEGVSETVSQHGIVVPWASVAPVLRTADIATANLEGVISRQGAPQPGRQYHFHGGPALLDGAARIAGIDVVTVANNHALDFGRSALLDTLAAARAAGIRTIGGGATLATARRPIVLHAGGLRIALLGYTDVRPLGSDAGPDWAGTARADPIAVAEDVHAAGARADVVVVWFHWGVELASEPTSRQRELAAAALAAGASVVLGAHPHVLQPLEREGRRLVAWSLGNFVFPANAPSTRRTGVLIADLDARGVVGARIRPATIHGFRPVLEEGTPRD
jgi:poly-gamma-glutamate synthesis protein (capsule biosynthesis protein)